MWVQVGELPLDHNRVGIEDVLYRTHRKTIRAHSSIAEAWENRPILDARRVQSSIKDRKYPTDLSRRRANKRRGRGTFANDRSPVLGSVGRESSQVRLRVVKNTTHATLTQHVEQFTRPDAQVYTDDYASYNAIERAHATVAHGRKEWARDADGDGIREVHTNTTKGMWTGLRPFRGVSKWFLSGYVAIHEFHVNLKAISLDFIAQLVRLHSSYS